MQPKGTNKPGSDINIRYQQFKSSFLSEKDAFPSNQYDAYLYKMVQALPGEGLKWFRVDVGAAGMSLVKIFPCGTKWIRVSEINSSKRTKSVTIETLSQLCIEFGEAITQEEFESNLLGVLTEIRLSALSS